MARLAFAILLFATSSLSAAPTKIAVLKLAAKRVPADVVQVLDDLLLASVGRNEQFLAIGPNDIDAMIGLEKMKDALGCDSVACAVELGGALGVNRLLSGTVSKLGDNVIMTLTLIDMEKREVVRRSKAETKNDENLFGQAIDRAVAELFGLKQVSASAAPEVAPVGCSDGSREGFTDVTRYPNIAGCSGGWSIPGLAYAQPPACSRESGNTGKNPNGAGCRADDLCAEGWHVCQSDSEVGSKSPTGCNGSALAGPFFFATRQSGPGDGACGGGENDLFGCGSLGVAPWGQCRVLDRFSHDLCSQLGAPWSCGNRPFNELSEVRKLSADKGGVLCCRD